MTDLTVSAALNHVDSWKLALRAENKAAGTITLYADCITRYLRWCAQTERLPMSCASLNHWVAAPLERGSAPGTARIRQQAVRRFADAAPPPRRGDHPADVRHRHPLRRARRPAAR